MNPSLRRAGLALVVAASAATSAYGDDRCAACTASSPTFDQKSGLCLPPSVEGFETVTFPPERVAATKGYRDTVAGGYNRSENRLAVTVFLYDREQASDTADDNEARAVVSEVLSAHRGAKLETSGKSKLAIGEETVQARGGLFTWTEAGADFASFLWVVPRESRYIKIRATYIRPVTGSGPAMRDAAAAAHSVAASLCKSQ